MVIVAPRLDGTDEHHRTARPARLPAHVLRSNQPPEGGTQQPKLQTNPSAHLAPFPAHATPVPQVGTVVPVQSAGSSSSVRPMQSSHRSQSLRHVALGVHCMHEPYDPPCSMAYVHVDPTSTWYVSPS